jgi:DNA polymerase elongation subunit (family B)
MTKDTFFAYKWHIDKSEENITCIRIYGCDENGDSVCVCIDDFTPYFYIELPTDIDWNNSCKAQLLGDAIDKLCGTTPPIKKQIMYKRKLYGSHIDKNGKYEKFPYLLCAFYNKQDSKNLFYKAKHPIYVSTCGEIRIKIHERDTDPVLQLACCQKIPVCGWINFSGTTPDEEDRVTICKKEYISHRKSLTANTVLTRPPNVNIMGMDIEVNSSVTTAMPNPEKDLDVVFQIACIISRAYDKPSDYKKHILSLCDPDPEKTGSDVTIHKYNSEMEMLMGLVQMVRDHDIHVIAGFNILRFDMDYLVKRAVFLRDMYSFSVFGFHKTKHAEVLSIKWSSSAYKNQSFDYLDGEGRLYIDLLPLIQRSYKFNNYKLTTCAQNLLGESKDPLSVKGIFKCWRMGLTGTKKGCQALGVCAKYCVQDALLCNKLMGHLHTWIDLTEMSRICNVQPFTLYTSGQQIKVYSQVYKFCMGENIVVEKDGYKAKDTDGLVGATVFDPVVGYHINVLPFDFASLYPTTIIAYNIDYSTWVQNEEDAKDSECHLFEWDDHIGCEHDPRLIEIKKLDERILIEMNKIKELRHQRNSIKNKRGCDVKANNREKSRIMNIIVELTNDSKPMRTLRSDLKKKKVKQIMCIKRRYRFRKEPMGVIPTIIQNLLDARRETRKGKVGSIQANKDEIKMLMQKDSTIEITNKIKTLNDTNSVLSVRQIAYKLSSNSMYGGFGVREGYLPFMIGAMITTYKGRTNIGIVKKEIPGKHKGEFVYGDTDSNYVKFPHIKDMGELWDYGLEVAKKVTALFPKPIELEFEEEIYADFFILTKKRYMYRMCKRDGVVDKKIGKKGVLLARRDSCQYIRTMYEDLTTMIFDRRSYVDCINHIVEMINNMFRGLIPSSNFVTTKSVGDCGDLTYEDTFNEKNEAKWLIGQYKIPPLPSDPVMRAEKMNKKSATNVMEYCLHSLPAPVQLGQKMRRRGVRVDAGSRLDYVITDTHGHKADQWKNIESAEYFEKYKRILGIDYLYYLKQMINSIDQIIYAAFHSDKLFKDDFVLSQYKLRSGPLLKTLNIIKSAGANEFKFTN